VTLPDHANRRRSERVMLQVPVVVRTISRDGKELRESTHTVVVNAHGGLLKLRLDIKVGQPIVIINEKANVQQASHVVRVETSDAGYSAVAFEFDEASPKFWPIVFPPADWNPQP
jgi:hypothetical protein